MMGERTVAQEALFYSFNLERHVPQDHLLRSIDRFVDLSGIREHPRPFHSSTGRPSVDPELMLRMLIIGYCMGVRSERRLCEEVHVNLAYRWFCRLGLEGDVPDHSTFSKNRHGRFRDSDLLRQLFETTVARCIAEGLVGGEGFAVDGSLVRADVNRQHAVDKADGLPDPATSHAVREYLAVLDDAAFGGATPVPPKQLAVADPAARWTAASRERAFFARLFDELSVQRRNILSASPSSAMPGSRSTSPSSRWLTAAAMKAGAPRSRADDPAILRPENFRSPQPKGFSPRPKTRSTRHGRNMAVQPNASLPSGSLPTKPSRRGSPRTNVAPSRPEESRAATSAMAARRAADTRSPRQSDAMAICAVAPHAKAAERTAPAPPIRHWSNRLAKPDRPAHTAHGWCQSTSLNSGSLLQNPLEAKLCKAQSATWAGVNLTH